MRSSTRELKLDYKKGLLTINTPTAQGLSGNLKGVGGFALNEYRIVSDMDNGHIMLISLDGAALGRSRRMLLQVMSEEQSTGFVTEDAGGGVKKITNIGRDPWRVKNLQGQLRFRNSRGLQIQPLDFNGYPDGPAKSGGELTLAPNTIYYLLTR